MYSMMNEILLKGLLSISMYFRQSLYYLKMHNVINPRKFIGYQRRDHNEVKMSGAGHCLLYWSTNVIRSLIMYAK